MRPWCGKLTNFTIKIHFTIEMLHTKICNNWMHSFEEDVKNVKLKRTMDDGRRPIAVSQLSVSGGLQIKKKCYSYRI